VEFRELKKVTKTKLGKKIQYKYLTVEAELSEHEQKQVKNQFHIWNKY